jgi:hypothetical protein
VTVTRDDTGDARRFLYRLARYKTDLRMDFEVGETVFLGICRSLSGSGLMGEFLDLLTVGTAGVVTLYQQDLNCAVQATVDTAERYEVRLAFHFDSDGERQVLESFLRKIQSESRPLE